MGLLGVAGTGLVGAEAVVVLAVNRFDEVGRLGQRLVGEGDRVGSHVGDQPDALGTEVDALVEALGGRHGAARAHAEPVGGGLLHGRCGEGRSRPDVGLRLVDRVYDPLGIEQGSAQVLERLFRLPALVARCELSGRGVEVGGLAGELRSAERVQPSAELLVADFEVAVRAPVLGADEGHTLAFPFDQEAQRDALHAPCRGALSQLAPEHRAEGVAVETIEDAPGFLRFDEALVDSARRFERLLDGGGRDLVEDDALVGHFGLEHFDEVPADRLAFAVLVGGEQDTVGLLEFLAQTGDVLLRLAGDDVIGLESVIDVDGEVGPGLTLDLGGTLGRATGKIADVSEAGRDDIIVVQESGDRVGLGSRFDDDQRLTWV